MLGFISIVIINIQKMETQFATLLSMTISFVVFALSIHGCSGTVIELHVGSLHKPETIRSDPVISSPSPVRAPRLRHVIRHPSIALAPSVPLYHMSPAYPPVSVPAHKMHHGRNHFNGPYPSNGKPLPANIHKGHAISSGSPEPALAPMVPPEHYNEIRPAISPFGSSLKRNKAPAPPPSYSMTLPPPPPNEDCATITCTDPLTYTPAGTPCGCVWPIQVELRLSLPIYTFFTLVTELAEDIAISIALNRSQVRIMGANSAQQLEKSIVIINLVPVGLKFNHATAFSIYKKFWTRQVLIKSSLFRSYQVLSVRYPGLPPSPPSSTSSINTIDEGPFTGNDSGRRTKPFGVSVPRTKRDDRLHKGVILVIVLSSVAALVVCVAVAWLLVIKCRNFARESEDMVPGEFVASPVKPSVTPGAAIYGTTPVSSKPKSISSSTLAYAGSAKTFSLNEIERATNNFDASRILGEGGFGLVYRGMVEYDGNDNYNVAIKVLKREDSHGDREFLAEVETLSRLHHRNLVKLIGICTEGHVRCLVYQLIPNGSLESHLHGNDKETDPLDWDARMKIALGAARGLAYLHEDSSPHVIHRDFKSSNILLEHDYTPKVSDFGLARTALDDANNNGKHISTHVMGTFGYLAPEYAMTGHLLVKSDVYSYGVVLLELLTGRKPVDLLQPPGQENLVAYARPLLTTKEGLETIIDPAIKGKGVSFDIISKVAAIASMCVQPDVSHRPFTGEVVQALKLVSNEFDEAGVEVDQSGNLVEVYKSREEVAFSITQLN